MLVNYYICLIWTLSENAWQHSLLLQGTRDRWKSGKKKKKKKFSNEESGICRKGNEAYDNIDPTSIIYCF